MGESDRSATNAIAHSDVLCAVPAKPEWFVRTHSGAIASVIQIAHTNST
jgi:hypothetical protein